MYVLFIVCDDESGLESNEYWGGSDGCNVFTFAPTTVENRELAVGCKVWGFSLNVYVSIGTCADEHILY